MGAVDDWYLKDGAVSKDGQEIEVGGVWSDDHPATLQYLNIYIGEGEMSIHEDEAAKLAMEILSLALFGYRNPELVRMIKDLHRSCEDRRAKDERDALALKYFSVEKYEHLTLTSARSMIDEIVDLRGRVKTLEGRSE